MNSDSPLLKFSKDVESVAQTDFILPKVVSCCAQLHRCCKHQRCLVGLETYTRGRQLSQLLRTLTGVSTSCITMPRFEIQLHCCCQLPADVHGSSHWIPGTHMRDLSEGLSSQFPLGPAWAVVGIWGMNQQMRDSLSLSSSLFLSSSFSLLPSQLIKERLSKLGYHLATLASQIELLLGVPATLLPVQHPVNIPGKARSWSLCAGSLPPRPPPNPALCPFVSVMLPVN